jgi:hypothetical protein
LDLGVVQVSQRRKSIRLTVERDATLTAVIPPGTSPATQLPPELVDYVLVHELAHRHYPDHGQDFWQTVGRALPDCQSRRARLRREGPGLWLPVSA